MKNTLINILLIEDNPADALLLQEALGRDALSSFQVAQAVRLKDGLEQLHGSQFDAVLLDLGLPDSQGMETLERALQQVHGIPILILSGLADEQLSVRAVQAGAQDYLVKSPAGWEQAPRAIRYAIERQRSREALSESERQYRELFENAVLGTFRVTADGKPIAVNPAFARMFGYASPEEFLGLVKNSNELFDDPQRRKEILRIRTGNPSLNVFENTYRRKDGSTFYGNLTLREIEEQDGQIPLLEGFIEDISERKQAEKALRESEELYRLLVETLPDGVIVHSQGKIVFANPASATIIGAASPAVLIGSPVIQYVHPDYRELASKRIRQSLSEHVSVPLVEERFVQLDGTLIDVQVAAIPISYAGSPAMLTVFNDITERKRAEEALRESEEHYRGAIMAAGLVPYVINYDNERFSFMGENILKLSGYSAEEITPAILKEIVQENHNTELDIAELTPDEAQTRFRSGKLGKWGNDMRIRTRAGEDRWINDVSVPLLDEHGKVTGAIGVIQDVTERKRAEEALARAAAEWQKTFDATTDGIYLLDKDQRFIRANKALGKLLNIETKNLPGKFCWQVVHGTSAPPLDCPMICACKSGKQERQVYKIGEPWFECLFDPIFTAEGEFDGGVHIIRDITERKRVEDQIAQQLDELQRWYNMTIDRESRSLELKREINDLLRRLNEPIRYYSAEK